MAMDELVRALAAQRQGAAQVPGLELQLERANALRDEGYDFRNQTGASGIGAALSGIGTMMNNAAGKRQAESIQPRLAAAREQVAGGEEARLLHNARRQATQDQLARDDIAYERDYQTKRDTVSDAQRDRQYRLQAARQARATNHTTFLDRANNNEQIELAQDSRGNWIYMEGPNRGQPADMSTLERMPTNHGRGFNVKLTEGERKTVRQSASAYSAMNGLVEEFIADPSVAKPIDLPTGLPSSVANVLAKGGFADYIADPDTFLGSIADKFSNQEDRELFAQQLANYRNWHANFQMQFALPAQHELFGAALTKEEAKQWQNALNVHPGMSREDIVERVQQLRDIRYKALARFYNAELETNPANAQWVRSNLMDSGIAIPEGNQRLPMEPPKGQPAVKTGPEAQEVQQKETAEMLLQTISAEDRAAYEAMSEEKQVRFLKFLADKQQAAQ